MRKIKEQPPSLEQTINKICYKGIEISLPTSITVNMDEIKQLCEIDEYALILHLFGESLSKITNKKPLNKGGRRKSKTYEKI